MANSNAPFGFSQSSQLSGPANYRISNRKISATNGTAIYWGDAVVPVTGSANGYITQATVGTVAIAGIFYGCSYQSVSQKQTVYLRYWPGTTSDAAADITAFVCDDPNAKFLVQASSAGFPFGDIGQNAQLAVGTGSTNTGFSGMYINAVGTTSTYPFIITGVPSDPTDPVATTGYNWLEVAFNNMIYKTGITGIS